MGSGKGEDGGKRLTGGEQQSTTYSRLSKWKMPATIGSDLGSWKLNTLKPDEHLKSRIEKLGDEAGRFFYNLENDLYRLRIQWRIYNALFGTNHERVTLLNQCSGITAHYFEKSMFESAMLSICRMTDSPEAKKISDKNITVRRLPGYLTGAPDLELCKRLDEAIARTAFARSQRNKRLAHADDDVRNGRATVDSANLPMMKDATNAIAGCIRRFATIELEVSLDTHPISHYSGDEVYFLNILSLGLKKNEEIAEIARGYRNDKNWNALKLLKESPSWLTFRPADEHDAE